MVSGVMTNDCCRFGRLTVVTLESKLEARDKEVQQLTRALEKSDEHIISLENELQACRSQQLHTSMQSTVSSVVEIAATSLDSVSHETCSTSESCRKKLKFTSDNSTTSSSTPTTTS